MCSLCVCSLIRAWRGHVEDGMHRTFYRCTIHHTFRSSRHHAPEYSCKVHCTVYRYGCSVREKLGVQLCMGKRYSLLDSSYISSYSRSLYMSGYSCIYVECSLYMRNAESRKMANSSTKVVQLYS